MIELGDRHNRTLLGYHDKSTNQYTLIDKRYPVLTQENLSPFLLTKEHHYSISTVDIVRLINNYKALESFNNLKNLIAQILLLPGLVISIIYLIKTFDILDSELIELIITGKFTNLTFWISVLGVIILWHDYYRIRSHPIKFPSAKKIEEKEFAAIRNSSIQFGKYHLVKAVHYLSPQTQRLLIGFTHQKGVRYLDLFNAMLQREDVQYLVNRAGLKLNNEQLGGNDINQSTMPQYPLPSLRSIVVYAAQEALLTDSNDIKPVHLFLAFMRVFPVLSSFLTKNQSSIEILREVAWFMIDNERKEDSVNLLNTSYPYFRTGGIGKEWIYGYTFVLNKFSKDLTRNISFDRDRYGIGHDREVEELISVVGRMTKNNALLIGEPGVGKSSIIKGIAQRINWGNVPQQLQKKRIIQLDINALLASSSKNNIEALIQRAMGELENAGNTILYIDEIQALIPAKSEESGQSLAGLMLPYILESKFPIVGSINYSDYKRYFYSNDSIKNSFEPIEVAELSPSSTLRILLTKIEQMEKAYGIYITFPALVAAIELAQRYIANRKLPDSAVGAIEAACSWAQSEGIKQLTPEEVAKSISVQTNVPVESVNAEEATRLLSLEQRIKERVIGQDEAVHAVVESLKRARTDIRDSKKPIGVFLFLGPTGTGKTHLSKILSEEYFGSGDIVRVDMSEYQEVSSINKLLGSSQGGDHASITLLDQVKNNPFTVVLFDEIEKAHPQVLDLFLQLFDEGRLTSNSGETINFTNTIIISTSNIGSKNLLDALERDGTMWEEAKQTALLELRGALRPELLNRFDKVIVFSPHDINQLISITRIQLNELAKRLSEKGIALEWGDTTPMLIANRANEPGMGARPIKRFIQENIEVNIADEILSQSIKPGDTLVVRESWITGQPAVDGGYANGG